MKLARFVAAWDQLGPVERDVLVTLAERMVVGRETYGELAVVDDRDMLQEATEELLDATMYLCVRLMRGRR